ncbi:uncharacterized protein TNCV_1394631 [Trichonephila clavipes]|nr:uncharacterized protein TNCV_1394631 [Trichonephila clavipes]
MGDKKTCVKQKGLEDGLAMLLPLSEPREIDKDRLEMDNRSNIGSEFNFEIDLPGKRDCSTIYRLNLIKLYRRQPDLANLVMENSSEGIDFETLYSMLINSLQEDTEYLLDLGVNGMVQSNRTLPVVWLGRVNRYPYPRIKCMKYRNLNQVTSTSCKMTSARDYGAIVYCLNSGSDDSQTGRHNGKGEPEACLKRIMSSFPVLREGDNRNRWRDGQEMKEKKRDGRERGARPWMEKRGKSPALDGESMRGEPWLERTGRERERKGLSPRLEWKDDERRWR